MDVILLSQMVRELILENDAVTLAGLGTFVAEVVPSTFSDKGYTINPPYRRLSFTRREGTDTLLADRYATLHSVSREAAGRDLWAFLSDLKEELTTRKTVVMPGLGRLRATRENNFFFVPEEDLDIYPAGFGLRPVSLKTHQETPEEVSAAVSELAAALAPAAPAAPETPESPTVPAAPEIPEAQAAPEAPDIPEVPDPLAAPPEPEVPTVFPTPEAPEMPAPPVPESRPDTPAPSDAAREEDAPLPKPSALRRIAVILAVAAALFALGLILLAILGRVAPDLVDPLLYTREELELLRM